MSPDLTCTVSACATAVPKVAEAEPPAKKAEANLNTVVNLLVIILTHSFQICWTRFLDNLQYVVKEE
ncbi:hypothetical protein GCM10008918_16080 [Lactobacillus kefiranofaciens subsp. kefiranofaciens]